MENTRHQLSSKLSCSIVNGIHHGITIIDNDRGEIICNNCGVVLEEKTLSYEINKKEVIDF